MRSLVLTVLVSVLATGAHTALAASPCNEVLSECREDCLIEFGGSASLPMKKKYDKCLGKCVKTASLCTERALEVDRNQLDDGSLDKSPGSREVDSDGFSTAPKATPKKSEADPFEAPAPPRKTSPTPATVRESPALAPPLSQSETPKSSRSELAVDPKTVAEPKPAVPSEMTEAPARAASESVPAVPKKADALRAAPPVTETKKAAEAERREDLKPAPTAAAEPAPVQRKTVTPKPEKKRDDDDLRNF